MFLFLVVSLGYMRVGTAGGKGTGICYGAALWLPASCMALSPLSLSVDDDKREVDEERKAASCEMVTMGLLTFGNYKCFYQIR